MPIYFVLSSLFRTFVGEIRGSGNTEDYFIKDCSSSISINRDNSQDRGKNNMPYLD